MARHGCRVLETGEIEQAKKKRLESDKELDKKIESEVERLVETMPSKKALFLLAITATSDYTCITILGRYYAGIEG